MGWFRRSRRLSEEELLARENPLLTPGQWEELLGSRRSLHRRRTVTTSREFRREWKYILIGAVLAAIVVGCLSFIAQGIWVWRVGGYYTGHAGDETLPTAPSNLLPILTDAAVAGAVCGFLVFFVRRTWRRR